MALLLCATLLAAWAHTAHGELLTPPYFNLAEGRRISATATCGDGDNPSELYCKLVGASAEDNQNIIHGQVNIFAFFSCIIRSSLFLVLNERNRTFSREIKRCAASYFSYKSHWSRYKARN